MTLLVATVGLVVLIGLAVLIGISMDTAAQRDSWKRVADERRLRNEEFQQLQALRLLVVEERLRLAEERRRASRKGPDGFCDDCPLRQRGQAR